MTKVKAVSVFPVSLADLGDIGLSYLSRQVILPDCASFREQSPLSSSSCRQGDKSLTSDGPSSKETV